jgi:hypothetical protein
MKEYVLLDQLIIKLMALLGASLLIERLLTFLGSAMNRLLIFQYSNRFTLSEKIKTRIDRDILTVREQEILIEADKTGEQDADLNEVNFNPDLQEEKKINSGFDVMPIRSVNEIINDEKRFETYKENSDTLKEFWMQVFGSLVAIAGCMVLKFSIWEFFDFSITGIWPAEHASWEYVFTGIIIGSGSKPISFLMKFLVERKVDIDSSKAQEEAKELPDAGQPAKKEEMAPSPQPVPAILITQPASIEELVGFEYDGGDRPRRLETTHLYPGNIDLIVYHHTTQHSDAPFAEIVKEFDRKGWTTGYHCVVFQDGTIRILCRWDRFGNHAKPHNSHSFGIAFQGNFEPNPNVPCSNVDGRLGILTPKPAQLQAAARVTAMYALMHGIHPKFHSAKITTGRPTGIMPHNIIAAKACPGSNFPKAEFEDLIIRYYNKWKPDDAFREALSRFRNKPMVYPKNA